MSGIRSGALLLLSAERDHTATVEVLLAAGADANAADALSSRLLTAACPHRASCVVGDRIQRDHIPFWTTAGLPFSAAGQGWGQGVRDIVHYVSTLNPSTFVRESGFMDPDFLETLFAPTMSFVDSKAEVTFWSLWAAPLLVATDVRNMSSQKAYLLMNPEVLGACGVARTVRAQALPLRHLRDALTPARPSPSHRPRPHVQRWRPAF